jgi:hypothetical protein
LFVTAAGRVYNYGTTWLGSPAAQGAKRPGVVGIAAETDGGYVVVSATGRVYTYRTTWAGSPYASGVTLTTPVVAVTTASGTGYTLATASGTAYGYGDGAGA